jgi:polysaccharide biosynthesis protein PslH
MEASPATFYRRQNVVFRRAPLRWISVRLLFLSPRESWPPTSGAKLRDYYFARGLAQGLELCYVFFGSDDAATEMAGNLASGSKVIAVPPPAKYSGEKIVRGLFGRYPLPVQNYTSAQMRNKISELLGEREFDIVHLDSIHFAAYLPLVRSLTPSVRVILNWHNIESELMERYAQSASSFPRKLYANITARQMRKLEDALLDSCFAHIVCSDRESEILSQRSNKARIEVVPNGVDTSYFAPERTRATQDRLVFVGQMSYHANADGIAWFVREIWPSIRNRYPDFGLSIVGSSPGPAVQALADRPGVEVTGTVPDVRPFYSGAYAAIVPLLTGGGTRLKILEAMAAGTPVISTSLGAEGLPVTDRREVLLADTPGSWLEALDYLSNTEQRSALIERARQMTESRFDWEAIGRRLLELYLNWSKLTNERERSS